MNTDFARVNPFPQHWSAQDLTDAVRHRLSDLITPELMRFDRGAAANGVASSPWAFDFRRHDREASFFRVR